MVHIRNSLLTGSTQGIYGALYLELISNPWLLLIIENSVISNNIMTDVSKLGVGMTVYIPCSTGARSNNYLKKCFLSQ